MKMIIYTLAILVVVIAAMFIALSLASRKQPELGLHNGQLRACPATPNCVCSEQPMDAAYVEPLAYTGTAEAAWVRIKQVIAETGGRVIGEEADYLRVVYETPLLRYIDDVELRRDAKTQQIHIRSASRVGHSDMGANRKRVETLRTRFTALEIE